MDSNKTNPENWSLTKLQNGKNPQALFLEIFESLATTQTSRKLLKALTQRITFAFPLKGMICVTDVEHPESLNNPGEAEQIFLAFQVYINKDRSENILVAPPQNDNPVFKAGFWKDFGYVEFCECKLFGSFNTSIWENDDYVLEEIGDESLLGNLSDLPYCAIEVSQYQWVVSNEELVNFWLVTRLLHKDFESKKKSPGNYETLELDYIECDDLGEIYLRLLYTMIFEQSSKQVIHKEFVIDP